MSLNKLKSFEDLLKVKEAYIENRKALSIPFSYAEAPGVFPHTARKFRILWPMRLSPMDWWEKVNVMVTGCMGPARRTCAFGGTRRHFLYRNESEKVEDMVSRHLSRVKSVKNIHFMIMNSTAISRNWRISVSLKNRYGLH